MTLRDFAKYSITRSVARSLYDSWASCFSFQRTTRAQEHWAAVTQDAELYTRRVASQQTMDGWMETRLQSCRLQDMDSRPGMHLSQTARDVTHRRWAVVINRWIYYISQGRVETAVGRGGQFCCIVVANQNIAKWSLFMFHLCFTYAKTI